MQPQVRRKKLALAARAALTMSAHLHQSVPLDGITRQILRDEREAASQPINPWTGVEADDRALLGRAGLSAVEPSNLVSHRGYTMLFSAGDEAPSSSNNSTSSNYSSPPCLLALHILRPGSRRWTRSRDCPTNQTGVAPSWWKNMSAMAGGGGRFESSHVRLRAPSVIWDPLGRLPDANGNQSQHVAVYYHVHSNPTRAANAAACIGRMSARWLRVDARCEPRLQWQYDSEAVLCDSYDAAAIGNSTAGARAIVARHPHLPSRAHKRIQRVWEPHRDQKPRRIGKRQTQW